MAHVNHSEAVSDIEHALHEVRAAFVKHRIPVPDILRWTNPKDAGRAKEILYSLATRDELVNFRFAQPSESYGDRIATFNIEWI